MTYERSICIGFGLFEAIMAVTFALTSLQDEVSGQVAFLLGVCAAVHAVLAISLLTGEIGYRD